MDPDFSGSNQSSLDAKDVVDGVDKQPHEHHKHVRCL